MVLCILHYLKLYRAWKIENYYSFLVESYVIIMIMSRVHCFKRCRSLNLRRKLLLQNNLRK